MSLLCLSAADVARVTSNFSPEALQSLMAHVFSVLSRSDAENPSSYTPARIVFPTQNHTALFMPARIAQPESLRGTSIKVVCVPTSPADPRGLPASTLVLDEDTGAVKAILNAANLTALRNAAGSLLSTNLVGPRNPTALVAFGAGAQVEAHLLLHLRAFPSIRTCTIVNRSVNERASKLVDLLRARFPAVDTSCISNDANVPTENLALKDALLSANLIICATSSTVPLFPSSWVADGSHVVLIGSYKPTMHEVDGDLVRRAISSDAGRLLVDSRSACLEEAGELIAAGIEENQVVEIGNLVSFDADGGLLLDPARQPPPAQSGNTTGPVTIFKSVGVGLQDVAIACAVVQKAEEMGIGRSVDWA
ncbi:NAD-binding protein [Mycena epipterygia]|nr:NAD-binding protein [Mycena epipterygia]